MSDLLTLVYSMNSKENLTPDWALKDRGDYMVNLANNGVGHQVMTVCQQSVIDEARLRVARGEFRCPVEVRHDREGHPQWVGQITKYGTLPGSPWKDHSMDAAVEIVKLTIARRRAEREGEA